MGFAVDHLHEPAADDGGVRHPGAEVPGAGDPEPTLDDVARSVGEELPGAGDPVAGAEDLVEPFVGEVDG